MKYLLDTHTLLWYMNNDNRLSAKAHQVIDYCECCYSMASIWEVAIKEGNGKLELSVSLQEFCVGCEVQGISFLQIMPRHMDVLVQLPNIHRDPFDRLLIAQAISEGLTLVTKDGIIPKYNVPTLWE